MSYVKKYNKNEILFEEGSCCTAVGVVTSGEIAISSVSYKGTEILYRVIKKGEYFGNNLIFSEHPLYRGNVIAKKESVVSYFTKDEFLHFLQEDSSLLEEYLKMQSLNARSQSQDIKILSLPTAEEKLFYLLSVNGNHLVFESITDLSKKLFLSREATSRCIHKLEKDKIIRMDGSTITKA